MSIARPPYFRDYAKRFTDLPLLVTLREREGAYVPRRLLRASDLGGVQEVQEHGRLEDRGAG